ncbi:hypothetical protein NMK34_18570 [Micromonospora sp. BRA006-A]|uniref:hypothetical protein n=1 Tax=Micromonospora sp. BRA006-A TaxID=2962860 RepID=UPI00296ED8B5|nr:hypothetical protein [Micromonospora sp. BRA006-A]MDW3848618.1 hypothetical protein [Micromonospora sp. BRA006-A]
MAGGAADVAAAARELVLLHGARDPRRIVRAVEHVTAAPAPDAMVRLHTRWGVVRLGAAPRLEEVATDGEVLRAHLTALGVPVDGAAPRPPVTAAERAAAVGVLRRAAVRGYSVAKGTDRG